MDAAPPTFPFHIARAYAVGAPVRPAPAAAAPGMAVRPSGDSVTISARPAALRTSVERLVAAKVDKAPEFVAQPPPASGALPMYRHPADRNIAATGVQAGRVIDVSA